MLTRKMAKLTPQVTKTTLAAINTTTRCCLTRQCRRSQTSSPETTVNHHYTILDHHYAMNIMKLMIGMKRRIMMNNHNAPSLRLFTLQRSYCDARFRLRSKRSLFVFSDHLSCLQCSDGDFGHFPTKIHSISFHSTSLYFFILFTLF